MLKKILIAGFSALISISVQADDVFGEELPLVWSPIVTLSGGPAWTTPGQDLYLYPVLPATQIDHYIYNSPTKTIATGEIFFGLRRIAFPGATAEAGIGLAGATDAKISGSVTVNDVPGFGEYNYSVEHMRVDLKAKLIANCYRLQPYISGSIGPSWNNSHDFRATSINSAVYTAPWFATRTNIAFAYTLGVGVQAVLNPHWQVGVGYEFADWGKSGLGLDNYTNIVGPNLVHLYTNELLFSISYLL